MKRPVLVALIILIPVIMLNAQESRRLTILHTNDFHSHLQGYAPESAVHPWLSMVILLWAGLQGSQG